MNDKKIWLETEDGQKLFIIKIEKCDMQKELTETINYLQQELQRKDNNWNELKEFILNHYIVGHKVQNSSLDMIINKMKELENGRSDE